MPPLVPRHVPPPFLQSMIAVDFAICQVGFIRARVHRAKEGKEGAIGGDNKIKGDCVLRDAQAGSSEEVLLR